MIFTTRRVQVHGFTGVIRHVHPSKAVLMLSAGQAEPIDSVSIRITGGLSTVDRAGRDDGRRTQTSNKTTFIQRLDSGRLIQHKHIDPLDLRLYRLAVTENLVSQ